MDTIETYKAVFDSSPDGVIITDNHGKILLVNNQVEKLFGYAKSELIGHEIEILVPTRFHHNHASHRASYSASPAAREMGSKKELCAKRKDGSEFAVEISLSPITLKERTIFSAAIRDVTERKKIEREIENQNKRLQIQNSELAQFTYITSHDLQEPLRSLISFTHLLEKEYSDKLDNNAKTYINFISRSSKRMQDLVKGLLDYSRIGKERELAYLDCNLLVSEVLSDMTSTIKECSAKIHVDFLPTLTAYNVELRQLFQNLISNGLKYMARGVAPEIHISVQEQENEWVFSIQDNGIGIDEMYKERIFVIFKRLHNRNDYEGTGIGLSHCKKIVELHGGRIWVESKLKEGSTFYFTIPKNITV